MSEETLDCFCIVNIPVEVPTSRVRDLLVTAFEGGSNYWIGSTKNVLADGLKYGDFQEGGKFALDEYFPGYILVPFHRGCCLEIKPEDEEKSYRLTAAAMKRGLEIMGGKEDYKYHWQNFINENDDAETADVFLQLCLFGDIVYG